MENKTMPKLRKFKKRLPWKNLEVVINLAVQQGKKSQLKRVEEITPEICYHSLAELSVSLNYEQKIFFPALLTYNRQLVSRIYIVKFNEYFSIIIGVK